MELNAEELKRIIDANEAIRSAAQSSIENCGKMKVGAGKYDELEKTIRSDNAKVRKIATQLRNYIRAMMPME